VRPVEPDSPPLTVQDAISKAEAFVPRRIGQEGGQLPQPSEAKDVTVQKSADLTPQPSIPTQPQTAEPTTEPSKPTAEEAADRHSQDWGGDWGRLKNILRKHEEKTASEGPREEPKKPRPEEPKPRPKRLRDVQRRVTRGGRYPKAGEKRRAKIEYVAPGQPVTIPEKPAEVPIEPVSEEVEEAAASSRVEERPLSLEPGADVGETEAAIQRAEELPEDSVETEEATPSIVGFDSEPEAAPSDIPSSVETSIQREVLKEAVEEAAESAPESASESAPESAPEAASETAPDEGVDIRGEGEKQISSIAEPGPEIAPGDSPAPIQEGVATAIQKAEAPAAESKTPEEPVVDKPAEAAPETVDDQYQVPAVSLSVGEVQKVDISPPEEAEIKQLKPATEEVGSTLPSEAVGAIHETKSSVKADSPQAIQRQPAETFSEGPSEGYDDQLQAAIQRAEAPPQAPPQAAQPSPETQTIPPEVEQAESEPEERVSFGQRLFDRARRLFSREEPPASLERPAPATLITGSPTPEVPVVKATLAAPLSAQTFAEPAPLLERGIETQDLGPDISEGEPVDLPIQAIQRAESAPRMAAPRMAAPKTAIVKPVQPTTEPSPVSTEQPKLADESIQAPVEVATPEILDEPKPGELTDEPGVGLDAAEAIGKAEQAIPLEEAWPVERIIPTEPIVETVTEKIKKEQAARTDVAQRKSAGGDSSADQVDEALRQVAPEEYTDSTIELITPRRPRPKLKPTPEQIVDEAIVKAEAPTPDISTKREGATADTQEAPFQRIPFAGLPVVPGLSPSEIASPSPETAPPGVSADPSQFMVPTEVGELPSDLWRLIGQRPPQPPPTPIGDLGRDDAQVQREPTDVGSAIAVAERPALAEVMSQDVVQRVESRQAISEPTRSEPMEVEPTETQGSEQEVDIEELARKVYSRLKTKLRIERERSRGRF
jgi:hypothetical protein